MRVSSAVTALLLVCLPALCSAQGVASRWQTKQLKWSHNGQLLDAIDLVYGEFDTVYVDFTTIPRVGPWSLVSRGTFKPGNAQQGVARLTLVTDTPYDSDSCTINITANFSWDSLTWEEPGLDVSRCYNDNGFPGCQCCWRRGSTAWNDILIGDNIETGGGDTGTLTAWAPYGRYSLAAFRLDSGNACSVIKNVRVFISYPR